ncbi:MAG: hypothetical protein ABI955_00785, partial [Nitrospirota bacterium]
MEYELVKAPGLTTEMVKWQPDSQHRMVDLLKQGEGNLVDLGDLDGKPQSELVKWLSQNGLLGFRPPRALSHSELLHLINLGSRRVHGPENRMFFAYEPVCLIREAVQIAKAASRLYGAIRIEDPQHRKRMLEEVIQMNPHTRSTGEIEMSVFGVPIGLHIEPRKSIGWTRVALEGLADLTDLYLRSEFSLYREEGMGITRSLDYGWKVR